MNIKINRSYCGMIGNKEVLNFIENFLGHQKSFEADEILKNQFNAGYCYYFAVMLKAAFNRGEVCCCVPYGHMCWVDDDNTPYDIYGICTSEADYFIPVSYLGNCLNDFLHIDQPHYTTQKEIDEIIQRYLEDQHFSYECDVDKNGILDAINNHNCYDTWGEVVYGNGRQAVDYNICIDNTTDETENLSAFYKLFKNDKGYWQHDECTQWYSYKIDFSDKDWKNKLKEAAKRAYKELFN